MYLSNWIFSLVLFTITLAELYSADFPSPPIQRRYPKGYNRPQRNSYRGSRFLSLITVINFENQECLASTGDTGVCLAEIECANRNGVSGGPCANGYGTCCIFMVTCGETLSQNGTYFVNRGYPKMYDGTGSCQVTILKNNPDVCQFRLDFDQFNLAGPEPMNNVCTNDQFIVSGGPPISSICGRNTGSHMYVDAGIGQTNPITLTFVTSGPSFPRLFKVRVSQIPCNTIYRAEEGCLQYYTGVSGKVQSFNYDPTTGLQLSNQDYTICIRMERNFCGIQYTACEDTDSMTNRSQSFTISGNSNNPVQAMVGSGQPPNACNADWLIIPCATNIGRPVNLNNVCVDRICGGTFSSEISLIPATVMSSD